MVLQSCSQFPRTRASVFHIQGIGSSWHASFASG